MIVLTLQRWEKGVLVHAQEASADLAIQVAEVITVVLKNGMMKIRQ